MVWNVTLSLEHDSYHETATYTVSEEKVNELFKACKEGVPFRFESSEQMTLLNLKKVTWIRAEKQGTQQDNFEGMRVIHVLYGNGAPSTVLHIEEELFDHAMKVISGCIYESKYAEHTEKDGVRIMWNCALISKAVTTLESDKSKKE